MRDSGDVVTLVNRNCTSTATGLMLHGADALLHLDAWKMKSDDESNGDSNMPRVITAVIKSDDVDDASGHQPAWSAGLLSRWADGRHPLPILPNVTGVKVYSIRPVYSRPQRYGAGQSGARHRYFV
jgi:hypothetical protein